MNPGKPKSGSGTPHSVSDFVNMETDELRAVAEDAGLGVRKQEALMSLVILMSYNLLGIQTRWLLMCTDWSEVEQYP